MKYLACLLVLALITPAFASDAGATTSQHLRGLVPVPANPAWISSVLLLALWLTVAAAILGPLIKYFDLFPKVRQTFANDSHTTHSASSTTHH